MPKSEFAFFYAVCVLLGFVLGATIGSGVICAITRRKTGEPWVTGRSHCDSCGRVLVARDLIPIISFLCLKGRCRYCGENIPEDCITGELIFGMLGVVLATNMLATGLPAYLRIALSGIATVAVAGYALIFAKKPKRRGRKGEGPS